MDAWLADDMQRLVDRGVRATVQCEGHENRSRDVRRNLFPIARE